MELAYQLWNPNSGSHHKVVLLHGMGGTGSLWRPIAAALEEDCDILAPDQRGHGKSQLIPDSEGGTDKQSEPGRVQYGPLAYGRDVIETLDALNFHPTWLVGHSMGVRTACAAAHLKPEWFQGLVLVDLGLSGIAGGGLGVELANFLRILPMAFKDRAAAHAFINANCPDPSIGQYLMAVLTRSAKETLVFPFDQSALIQTINAAQGVSITPWLKDLAEKGLQILALRGANSLVWSRADFETDQAQFEKFENVRFEEFPNAGHGLPFEQRKPFIQRLREFMKIPELPRSS